MTSKPLRGLVAAFERQVRLLSPGDRIDVAKVIELADRARDPLVLRAGLAALLARNAEEHRLIGELVDHHFAGRLDELGQVVAVKGDGAAVHVRQEVGPWWSAVALGAAVGVLVVAFQPDPGERVVVAVPEVAGPVALPEVVAPVVTPPEPPPTEPSILKEYEPTSEWMRAPLSPLRAAVAWLAACALVLLGAQLRRAAAFGPGIREDEERKRDRRAEEDAERNRARADAMEQAWADAGSPPLHLFDAPAATGLEDRDVQDTALILGRISRWSGGTELDVEATSERAARTAGMAEAVMLPRGVVLRTVVLIDMDVGDHPWFGRFVHLANAWERTGAPVDVWVFKHHDPSVVYRRNAHEPVRIAQLARRTEGQPLVILSPDLHPSDLAGVRAWVGLLTRWERVAWIDPDPREPEGARGERVAWLVAEGVRRFPFNRAGVVAAVDHLAGGDRPMSFGWCADPKLPDGHDAWRWWALAAAHVPDPTWDQLEVFRRRLPEVARWFPEPDQVAYLVAWVERQEESRGRGVRERGEGLHVSDGLELRLEKEARRRAARDESWADYARRVDDILLGQLSHVVPEEGTWQHAWWVLKSAWITARRHPERAEELFEVLRGPLGETLQWMVEREGEVQREAPLPGLDWATTVLRGPGSEPVSIPVVRWVWPVRVPWLLPGLVVAAGLTLVALGADGGWVPVRREVEWPPLRRVVVEVKAAVAAPVAEDDPAPVEAEARGGAVAAAAPVVQAPATVSAAAAPPGEDGSGGGDSVAAAPGDPMVPSVTASTTPPPPRWKAGRVRMVEIPAGSFWMGSPATEEGHQGDESRHRVTLTRPFLLATTEVTQGLYREVMGALPGCQFGERQAGDDLPMHCVSWEDAVAFSAKLSVLDGLPEGEAYRLPTEAEWEYAARGGTAQVWAGTSEVGQICTYGNVADLTAKEAEPEWTTAACADGFAGLAPVARFRANAWDLHDMTGNVWEWTADWYGDYGGAATDPSGPPSGSYRVYRGGSWRHEPAFARVARRIRGAPSGRYDGLGFRLARSLPSALSPSDPLPAPEAE